MQDKVAKTTIDALHWLSDQRMISWDRDRLRWSPTTLGSAVMVSTMDPDVSLEYIQVPLDPFHGRCLYCE